jgi:hypothetical protein
MSPDTSSASQPGTRNVTTAPAPAPASTAQRSAGGVLAAGLLYLLLVDAAVETWLAGSPVRWVIGATVAAYLALSVLLRRRLAPGTRAGLSLLVLLGLLAFAAWRPDGTSVGIVMLRQPPGAVLAALTTVAIVLAGWSLVRLKRLPAAARVVVGLLTVYGAAATVWAIAAATPYPALVHGQSLWTRLPFWLQGAFIGGLVIVPAGLVAQAVAAVVGRQGTRRRGDGLLAVASAFSLAVVVAGFVASPGTSPLPGATASEGPGLRPLTIASLPLPVPRAFDLSHVDPVHFAAALGKDPLRIFEFVRDQVAYEPYAGCLRGPRGTLLAMAGNSVDRAALLGSLLTHSGQRVRYAHGTLTEGKAADLVASLWAQRARVASSESQPQASPEVEAAVASLVSSIRRDGGLLRDGLKNAGLPAESGSVPLESLTREDSDHYWIQWWRDGVWVDLDPTFATATPGTAYGQVAATLDALPDTLFHRVDIRVRLEEYTGDKPSSRVILQYSAKAADLSGVDLALVHEVEKRQLKPSFRVSGQRIAGSAFWLKAPSTGGGAGFESFLGGGGQAETPVATASAEFIDFDFLAPGGRKETVVREIFDLVGPARRRKGETLSGAEVASRTGAQRPDDLVGALYDLFITTGAIHSGHLVNVAVPARPSEKDPVDIRAALQRVNIAFASISDALLGRIATAQGSVCRFYLDSPRVQVAEFSTRANGPRLSLDLRRDQARVVGTGFRKEHLFYAQVLRGVVDGTLERILIDSFAAFSEPTRLSWAPAVSTSSLFERARASSATTTVLTPGTGSLGDDVAADSRARIEEALAAGCVVLVPQSPMEFAGAPRYAWWQVDARSGTTTAVTDEGLHQAVVEMSIQKNKDGVTVWTTVRGTDVAKASRFANHEQAVRFVEMMEQRLIERFGNLIQSVNTTGPWWLP